MMIEKTQRQTRAAALVNARLIDPASGLDETGGVVIADGMIVELGAKVNQGNVGDAELIDCGGHILAPGLIDMLVFSGEPGQRASRDARDRKPGGGRGRRHHHHLHAEYGPRHR